MGTLCWLFFPILAACNGRTTSGRTGMTAPLAVHLEAAGPQKARQKGDWSAEIIANLKEAVEATQSNKTQSPWKRLFESLRRFMSVVVCQSRPDPRRTGRRNGQEAISR